MNKDFELPLKHRAAPPDAAQKLALKRAARLRDEEWQLHSECVVLARAALRHFKMHGEKRLRIADLARLLDLASRLGRLATGIPTEHIEHAWAEHENQLGAAQFLADLKRIYGQPVERSSGNGTGCGRSPLPRATETQSLERGNDSGLGQGEGQTGSPRSSPRPDSMNKYFRDQSVC